MKPKAKILIIAGSDSSGGAGIQADLKTVTSLGAYGMTAITAVTAQNTIGVFSVLSVSPDQIKKQIVFTSSDIRPNAVKIGMLHSSQIIREVISSIKKNNLKKIILDPVMVAKGGHSLINPKAIFELKRKLIKMVDLITPNIPEAEILSDIKIKNQADMISAANKLLKIGAKNVLIKGGHLNSKKIYDIFLNKKEIKIFYNKKIHTKNTHGTGCTLSSAITTYYGCGKSIKTSCEKGIKYVNQAIKSNINLGKGHGPINHLVSINLRKDFL